MHNRDPLPDSRRDSPWPPLDGLAVARRIPARLLSYQMSKNIDATPFGLHSPAMMSCAGRKRFSKKCKKRELAPSLPERARWSDCVSAMPKLGEGRASRRNLRARRWPVRASRRVVTLRAKQSPWKLLPQFSLSRERDVANITA